MNSKTAPIFLAILSVLLGAAAFIFYQSASSESRIRHEKERDLIQARTELAQKESQITELNLTLSSVRDTSAKRENALELAAREREETAKFLRQELDLVKKEREAVLAESLEKNQKINDLSDRLESLRLEKEELAKKIDLLNNQLIQTQQRPVSGVLESQALSHDAPPQSAPFGIVSDNDVGLRIDTVNLGNILISKNSGRAVRVQEVNSMHNFIIINAGEKDSIREGAILNIVRDKTLIGKAVVRRTRANASAAIILPEWKRMPVQKDDLITQF